MGKTSTLNDTPLDGGELIEVGGSEGTDGSSARVLSRDWVPLLRKPTCPET